MTANMRSAMKDKLSVPMSPKDSRYCFKDICELTACDSNRSVNS